ILRNRARSTLGGDLRLLPEREVRFDERDELDAADPFAILVLESCALVERDPHTQKVEGEDTTAAAIGGPFRKPRPNDSSFDALVIGMTVLGADLDLARYPHGPRRMELELHTRGSTLDHRSGCRKRNDLDVKSTNIAAIAGHEHRDEG